MKVASRISQTLLLTPFERNNSGSIGAFLNQRLVVLTAVSSVHTSPACFTIVLQASDVGAKEGRKFTATMEALANVTYLIVEHVRLDLGLKKL
jgi:hypothetical protein